MRDVIEEYLDEVLTRASLARDDERRVRAELKDHLEELAATVSENSPTPEEVLTMLNNAFGKPDAVGASIAGAKGRFRTYLKKQKRRLPIALAVGLVLAFSIQWAVAEEFYAATDAVAPNIPQGSRMIIYKLASTFHPGDIIVFHSAERWAMLGVVKSVNDQAGILTVARNGEPEQQIQRASIVGRVVANTR